MTRSRIGDTTHPKDDRPLTIAEFKEEINKKSETILKQWSEWRTSLNEFVIKLANGNR